MNSAGVYKRSEPEKTHLYNIVYNLHEEYERVYNERYEDGYGYFRNIISEVICKYLECGIFENGTARVYCYECGHDFFVAFSCKVRMFCPSCSQKRTLIWSAWVKENVLKNVPHRQWVFTSFTTETFLSKSKITQQISKLC